jgi:hypothetical protein
MGGCLSSPAPQDADARSRTQEIDRRIEDDYKKLRKEVKILLLGNSLFPHTASPSISGMGADDVVGSGESGKSTVKLRSLLRTGINCGRWSSK